MRIFILAELLAVTVYMETAAVEDCRTCYVSRWKHLIGFEPAVLLLIINPYKLQLIDYGCIFLVAVLFLLFAGVKIYGLADGFVLANLTLLFGGFGGVAGIGAVILILLIASASMLVCHLVKALRKKEKLFRNAAGAFVPHLLTGYMVVLFLLVRSSL